jgi:hypothetical protein
VAFKSGSFRKKCLKKRSKKLLSFYATVSSYQSQEIISYLSAAKSAENRLKKKGLYFSILAPSFLSDFRPLSRCLNVKLFPGIGITFSINDILHFALRSFVRKQEVLKQKNGENHLFRALVGVPKWNIGLSGSFRFV